MTLECDNSKFIINFSVRGNLIEYCCFSVIDEMGEVEDIYDNEHFVLVTIWRIINRKIPVGKNFDDGLIKKEDWEALKRMYEDLYEILAFLKVEL